MATTAEIGEALEDYRQRCNDNARLRKMLRKWSRVIEFRSLDSDAVFTVTIHAGEITSIVEGVVEGASAGVVDVRISATSEDMADMFWGDLNPAQKYLSGEIKVVGSAEDVLRVDAMAAVIWVD